MKLGSCIHLEELRSTLCSILRLDLLFTVHWQMSSFCVEVIFSSPEHEVLMVSYYDQSMSVVRRASCVVRRQQFVLKANSS